MSPKAERGMRPTQEAVHGCLPSSNVVFVVLELQRAGERIVEVVVVRPKFPKPSHREQSHRQSPTARDPGHAIPDHARTSVPYQPATFAIRGAALSQLKTAALTSSRHALGSATMADVQAAKSLIEEDAYGPRGYADDETILEEQRQLEADVKRSSEDAKGKARASDDGGDDGDRAGLMGNGTARRRSSSSPKHVRLATFPPTSGQLQDGEDGYVPRRSGEYSVRRATKLSKAQMRQRYWRSAAINVLFILSWSACAVPSRAS